MEKFTTEIIEQYLEGKLDTNEREKVEEAMALNVEFKEDVQLQKMLVQKIEEQALRKLINEAHLRHGNSGGFGSNVLPWIIGIILVLSMISGGIFFFGQTNNKNVLANENDVQGTNTESVSAPIVEGALEETKTALPEVPFMVYTFLAEKGAVIKDPRSGALIRVPANILTNKDGILVKGEVVLKYREFRTQADIALSQIPMTYKAYNFNSAGMFEIHALQNGDTLGITNTGDISIDFVMTKNEPGIGFYSLNDARKKWEFIRSFDSNIEGDKVKKFEFDEGDEAGSIGINQSNVRGSLKDPFIRSLGYQKAVLEGKNIIPEIPVKPKGDFNTLFNNDTYKQIAGSDTNKSNRILVEEMGKEFGGGSKGGGLAAFFKRMFFNGGTLTIPISKEEAPKVDTSLSIVVKDKRYTIFEKGKNIIMKELEPLKGTQFVYDGKDVFADLTERTFYDVRLTRDTTVLNRFSLQLKTDGKILTYTLRLSKPDFTSVIEYEKHKNERILAYNNEVARKEQERKDLIQLREDRKELMDSLSKYGDVNVYKMARLIMTEEELQLSKDEWFASLATNTSLNQRIHAHMDSIKAYGANADVYINKLAAERKQNIGEEEVNQKRAQQFNPIRVDPGHYFNPLVQNLKITGFGVYNCDQVYTIQNRIMIRGRYVTVDSVDITNVKAISLIDPKVNGAFSFDPRMFQCSASEDNMILLFTTDNKIYFFDKVKWKAKHVKQSGLYSFEMLDITPMVKKSADLQKILEESLL